ncbi:MAG TPA: S41 family peptidase [Acidimicrobiia bacterium]|nr:S41 family peptidase [Acidimicrobiia bacterium]
MRIAVVLLAFTLVACSAEPVPDTRVTTPVPTSTTSTLLPPAAEPYTIRQCSSAQPRPWSLLCRAHELVMAHHLDVPDAGALAAAAAAGVRRTAGVPDPDATREEGVDCIVPAGDYQQVCDAIWERHHSEGLRVDSLVEASVQGMFRFGLDPFSSYLAPGFAERIDALGSGHVFSVGLIVGARDGDGVGCGPISEECPLIVLAVFDFTAAAREGVLAGDEIIHIDGAPVDGLSETEAVASLHAAPGQTTTITVSRGTGTLDKHLEHDDVRTASVEYGMVGPGLAYLRVNDFSQEAAQAVGRVLSMEEFQSADGLVLDLRDNPGGLVLSAQAVASQFLRTGIVLVEETRRGRVELGVIAGGLVPETVDVVVVVNAGTASAGEIVAAALQAQGRAQIVGEATFGKNLVQEVFSAPGGGEFRITVARWTGPGGVDVAGSGLAPDVFVDVAPGDDAVLDVAFGILDG